MVTVAVSLLLTVVAAGLPLGYKPHVVFFLADDLGHYNLGYTGNTEMHTPTLNELAAGGLILDRHYTYQYCSPTRSSFLSGRLPVHVNTENRPVSEAGGVDIRMSLISDKLKTAGYVSHQIGKWHAGGSCTANLPIQRGFNSSFGYLDGEEDHYTQMTAPGYLDIWVSDRPGYGLNGSACPAEEPYCESAQYNAYEYVSRAVKIVEEHDVDKPLFLYHAFQEAHNPNEVPLRFQNASIDFELRRVYGGMVSVIESGVKNITEALRSKGMWDETLVVFSSDNGGRVGVGFGGNNYPLRGQKFTDFEGGVRVAAFLSGGALPPSKQGRREPGLIHICDWYATFCELAGVSPSDPSPDVPDIDSISMVGNIFGSAPSPRTSIVLSKNSVIDWPYKLVLGKQGGKGIWTGPQTPNSTHISENDLGCPEGCLFDLASDPTEHVDVKEGEPQKYASLSKLLNDTMATAFQTNSTPGYTNCVPFQQYLAEHKNFAGPSCTKGRREKNK